MNRKLPPVNETFLKFLEVQSISGNEESFGKELFQFIKKYFEYDVLEMRQISKNRYNIFLKKGNPKVILTSHLDTVPVKVKVRITKDRIYGNGSIDAKGQIIAQLYSLYDAIDKGLIDYSCLYVVGEEVDSVGAFIGAQYPDLTGIYILNGEPTNNTFVSKSWGVCELEVFSVGVESHTSIGVIDSAIHKLCVNLVNLLDLNDSEILINIGKIEGGMAGNVSAKNAVAQVNVRTSKSTTYAISQIKKALNTDVGLKINNIIEPLNLYVPNFAEKKPKEVKFCSDCFYFKNKIKNIMLFGPGDIAYAHTANEHILKNELLFSIATISDMLLRLNDSYQIVIKKYNDFTDTELNNIFSLREDVFVDEQSVPIEDEKDDYDLTAFHLICSIKGVMIGTLRIINIDGNVAKIGRFAVKKQFRGKGVGQQMLTKALMYIKKQKRGKAILEAQVHAKGFYKKNGFKESGKVFMDAGIPHVLMTKTLV